MQSKNLKVIGSHVLGRRSNTRGYVLPVRDGKRRLAEKTQDG
jgi:hypothetical protein